MRARVSALFFLFLLAAGLVSGCILGTPPAAPAAPAGADTPAVTQVTPKAVFTLGQEYHHKKYSFTSENDRVSEQLRVTKDPWAIEFVVNPTNTDPQYTWFEITATNIDTGNAETFGYGRTYPLDRHQLHPMYNEGPYRFDLKGNRVSVDVIIAKRNP